MGGAIAISVFLIAAIATLLNSVDAFRYLDKDQVADAKRDLPHALLLFDDLRRHDPGRFDVQQTDYLILDGVTCARRPSHRSTFGSPEPISMEMLRH